MSSKNNSQFGGILLMAVGLFLIAGIVVFYAGFVIPTNTNAEITELQLNHDNETTKISNETLVLVNQNSTFKVTDGQGNDVTRYVRFDATSENPDIVVTNSGQIQLDGDACTYSYEFVRYPYPHTIPVPQNFAEETYTMTYNGQSTNVTFTCGF